MCVLFLGLEAHPDYPLVVAANRDEFFDRPSDPAAPWAEAPQVIAGRDRKEGGSWMGVTRGGRFAAVTNFRDRFAHRPDRRSRGHLVGEFLLGKETPEAYLTAQAPRAQEYNWFNLIVGQGSSWHAFGSQSSTSLALAPGIHGISNGQLDEGWPKVRRGKARMAEILNGPVADIVDSLLALLQERAVAADEALPDTGVGLELERALSPLYVRLPERRYGTRSSTVVTFHRAGEARVVELTHSLEAPPRRVEHVFHLA